MSYETTTALVSGTQRLKVGQVKEWGEILTGFETRNKYVIRDERNEPMLLATENSGGLTTTLI